MVAPPGAGSAAESDDPLDAIRDGAPSSCIYSMYDICIHIRIRIHMHMHIYIYIGVMCDVCIFAFI